MASQPRIAILASGDRESGGGGSTAAQVVRDVLEERVSLEIGVVICNNAPDEVGVYDKIGGLNREFGLTGDSAIDVVQIGPRTHPDGRTTRGQTQAESDAVVEELNRRSVDGVAALGYLRIITGSLLFDWGWWRDYGRKDPLFSGIYHPKARIVNNHPGILPFTADTHGHGTHQRAIDLFQQGRIQFTAMTHHLVSGEVDAGPVIHETLVGIEDGDDAKQLAMVVQATEKATTSQVLADHFLRRSVHLNGVV